MSAGVVYVVPGGRSEGTCKYCHQRILWVTIARQGPGRPARVLPFDRAPSFEERAALQLEQGTTDGDQAPGVRLEAWPEALLHRNSCTDRPKPDPTRRRLRRSSRDGQGRMW